jgi:predicted nucleic acid-binding protein
MGYFQFYSCDYLRTEILQHRNKLMELTKLPGDKLAELEELVTHNITFIDERLLPRDLLLKTENLLKKIDPNDTPFVALSVYLKGKLWTGDLELYNA